MEKITISVSKWYNVLTPESREEGCYSETGVEHQTWVAETLADAVDWFCSEHKENCWENEFLVNEVLYAADPEIDYTDDSHYYHSLMLSVDNPGTIKSDRQIRIERALQYLIDKRI